MRRLGEGDLEELWAVASRSKDPSAQLHELMAAARTPGALMDYVEPAYALVLAADLYQQAGELEAALDLVNEAITTEPPEAPSADHLTLRAELLIKLGRRDEGMALLETFRQQLGVDPVTSSLVLEVLEATDQAELAVDWATTALRRLLVGAGPSNATRTDGVEHLLVQRRRLRADLGLEPDLLDSAARRVLDRDELGPDDRYDESDPDDHLAVSVAVLFWPESEWVHLCEQWPEVATGYGDNWRQHRRRVRELLDEHRANGPVRVAHGTVDRLSAYCADHGLDPATRQARASFAADLDRLGEAVGYPPERNTRCWCGSALKYKKCCLNRDRE